MDRVHLARKISLLVLLSLGAAAIVALPADSTGSPPSRDDAPHASALNVKRLPLGDRRYLTRARKGYVFTCSTRFGGGGSFRAGPWIDSASSTWDRTRKIAILGSVRWDNRFSTRVGSKRLRLAGNGLPPHASGVFPVHPADPAYSYDRNPNSIRSYTLRASLPRNPK